MAQDKKIIAAIVAIFVPPLGVYLKQGRIDTDFWIALVTMFLPPIGILFALYVILMK